MANFELSYKNMLDLEFNSPKNALHKNLGENGLTFMGIYEMAHPNFGGWDIVKMYLNMHSSLEKASEICYKDKKLQELVECFYKNVFWNKMKLDSVLPYRTADLIFKFAVNVGINRAVKFAQEVVNVKIDGVVGKNTIRALNSYSPVKFESEYKAKFSEYYKNLAKSKRYSHFLNGWLNRVVLSQNDEYKKFVDGWVANA
ncbi:MAG: peptidoglycan domain protein [Campylobacter sp.]|nr:peptidoglycan domain protein [Campylobacter sp.]